MEESILTSVKKVLGVTEDYEHFDQDIIMHINTAFFQLNQLAVGPSTGFNISDKSTIWKDFVGERNDLAAIKSFTYLYVRRLFDPPTTSIIENSFKEQLDQLTWRINTQAEWSTNNE